MSVLPSVLERREQMPKIIDLTEKKYGKLTVLSLSEKRYRNSLVWKCQCECGNIIYVPASSLKNGGTKSCGCEFKKSR